jgi:hypothetical protein
LNAVLVFGLHEHTCTARLNEEAENVPSNEDLGNEARTDEGQRRGVGTSDQAAEDHVDRGSKEDGRNENQDGLDDVWRFGDGVAMCCGAAGVANGFKLRQL